MVNQKNPRTEFHLTNDSQNRNVLFMIPGSIDFAKRHGQATSILNVNFDSLSNEKCPCCQNIITGEKFGICSSDKLFSKYGMAYTIFFYFILLMAFSALMIYLISGLLFTFFVKNSIGCAIHDCDENQFISHLKSHTNWIHMTAFCSFLALMFFRHFFKKMYQKWEEKYNELFIKPNDFTVFVSKFPESFSEEQIEKEIQKNRGTEKYKIVKITKIYNIEEFSILLQAIFSLEQKIKLKICKKQMPKSEKEKFETQLKKLLKEIDDLTPSAGSQTSPLPFVGSAFITFADEENKRRFLQEVKDISRFQDKRLIKFKVDFAPLPSDIIWEKYEQSRHSDSLKKGVFIVLVSFIILLSFSNLLFVEYLGHELAHYLKGFESDFVSVLSSVCVLAVNKLLKKSLSWSTTIQKLPVYSDSVASKIKKEVFAEFINTSLLLLLINIFYYEKFQINGDGKILQTVIFIVLLEFLIDFVQFIVDFTFLKKYFFGKKLEKDLKNLKNKKKIQLFQYELNSVYELEEFKLTGHLTSLFNIFGIVAFYNPIFPFGMLIVSIRLVFLYLMAKHEFVKRCSIPKELEFRFFHQIFDLSIIFLYQFVFGYIVFDFIYFGFPSIFTIAMIVALIGYLIGMNWQKKRNLQPEQNVRNFKYLDSQSQLYTDYDIKNPITRKSAIEKMISDTANVKSSYLNMASYEYFENLFESKRTNSDEMNVSEKHFASISPSKIDGKSGRSFIDYGLNEKEDLQKSYFKTVSEGIFPKERKKKEKTENFDEQAKLKIELK